MRESPERLLRRIRLGKDGATERREVVFSGEEIAVPGRDELADELAALRTAECESNTISQAAGSFFVRRGALDRTSRRS